MKEYGHQNLNLYRYQPSDTYCKQLFKSIPLSGVLMSEIRPHEIRVHFRTQNLTFPSYFTIKTI